LVVEVLVTHLLLVNLEDLVVVVIQEVMLVELELLDKEATVELVLEHSRMMPEVVVEVPLLLEEQQLVE
jgi:hypothetical protein